MRFNIAITSLTFIVFAFAIIIAYFIAPKKYQWVVLLVANGIFYCQVGWKAALFVLFTAFSVWFSTRMMEWILVQQKEQFALLKAKGKITKEERKEIKQRNQKRRKRIMLVALLANIGILCVVKYTHFILAQFNSLAVAFHGRGIQDNISLIVPLGISFYTFQAVGYLLDNYWEKIRPQKNFFKFLLFVSFFPQMTQGPISDYESLSSELFQEHKFSYRNFSYGMQRLLWGFAKKMLIANVMGVYVANVFENYSSYTGITTLLGAFCYSIQIYADFSGYMDIMCGLCEVLGIRLKENFDRPYFSKSIAEYWRRWHMTLGEWFKNYVYYPIGMSKLSRQIAKSTRKKFGVHFSNTLPATIALLVVWTATGLWHGASWGYIVWGLVNGAFIIFSMWMEPVYTRIKGKMKISDGNKAYSVFQIIRTFVLVTFIKVLPEAGGLINGIGLWKHIFVDHRIPSNVQQLFEFVSTSMTWFALAMIGTIGMLCVSLIQYKCSARELFNRIPYIPRIIIISIGIVVITTFGGLALYSFGGGGFMYEGY